MEQSNNLKSLLDGLANRKSTTKIVNNTELRLRVESLIKEGQPHLRGEYEVSAIYQNEDNELYSLIYSFYQEQDKISLDDMEEITSKEGKYLHEQLKKSGIKLDYLFIVPYYDYLDKESVRLEAVVTKDFN